MGGGLRLAFPFLAGVLIYRFYLHEPASRLRAPAWMLVAALIAAMAMPQGAGGAALDLFFSLVVLPSLVWFGLRSRVGPHLGRMCAVVGELSYPVYVIHKPIEAAMGHLARHLAAPERAAAACGCIAVIFSLSALVSRRYDAPLRRFLMAITAPRLRPIETIDGITPSAAQQSAGAVP